MRVVNRDYLRDRAAAALVIAVGFGLSLSPFWDRVPRLLAVVGFVVIVLTSPKFTIGVTVLLLGLLLVVSGANALHLLAVIVGLGCCGCGALLLWWDARRAQTHHVDQLDDPVRS